MDMTGIDILAMSDQQMQAAFPYHLPLPRVVRELVAQELLGQKTGAGVYKYVKGETTALPNDRLKAIIDRVRQESGIVPQAINRDAITERLVMRLVCEAFRVFEEEIILKESDLDVASVLAAGFPDFRGGIMKFAHDQGIKTIKMRLEALAQRFGDRFRSCSFLLKKTGE
jgi:3-hydroxyacyl-CoA dehydrogenase